MRLARRVGLVGPGDHLSDLNKTLARHKIGNTKWLGRATHSDTHRNFPGAVKLSLDIGQCGPGGHWAGAVRQRTPRQRPAW